MANKHSVVVYVDSILDSCFDTGVGIDKNIKFKTTEECEKYCKEHGMEENWCWLGMWMYDKKINLAKEIDNLCKKENTHYRDASYKILSKYYEEWHDEFYRFN